MRRLLFALAACFASLPFGALAAEFEARKVNNGQWFVFEGAPKTALLAPAAGEAQCYQIADVLILLDDAEQALDNDLLQEAARRGLQGYHDYCAAKGQRASNARNVIAFVAADATPDSLGRIPNGSALVSGVIRASGDPSDEVLEIRFNRAEAGAQTAAQQQAGNARAELERQQAEARAARETQAETQAETIRAKYGPQFEASRAAARYTGNLFSPDRVKLTGAWSVSRAQCGEDILLLIDKDGSGHVEWWRDTRSYGMLPYRIGSWSLSDDVITMDFTHRVESSFIGGFKDEAYNETVQLNLVSVSSDKLRLSSPGPNSPALKLLGADEKQFERCPV